MPACLPALVGSGSLQAVGKEAGGGGLLTLGSTLRFMRFTRNSRAPLIKQFPAPVVCKYHRHKRIVNQRCGKWQVAPSSVHCMLILIARHRLYRERYSTHPTQNPISFTSISLVMFWQHSFYVFPIGVLRAEHPTPPWGGTRAGP